MKHMKRKVLFSILFIFVLALVLYCFFLPGYFLICDEPEDISRILVIRYNTDGEQTEWNLEEERCAQLTDLIRHTIFLRCPLKTVFIENPPEYEYVIKIFFGDPLNGSQLCIRCISKHYIDVTNLNGKNHGFLKTTGNWINHVEDILTE